LHGRRCPGQSSGATRRLNPSDLVDILPEVTLAAAAGEEPCRYPDRVLAKNAEAAAKL
jgi:hypothetical protein